MFRYKITKQENTAINNVENVLFTKITKRRPLTLTNFTYHNESLNATDTSFHLMQHIVFSSQGQGV